MAEGVNAANTKYPSPFSIGYYRDPKTYNSNSFYDWKPWLVLRLNFTSKVCTRDEMGATLEVSQNAQYIPVVSVKDCMADDYWSKFPAAETSAFCAGSGYGRAARYREALGWMVTKGRRITSATRNTYFVVDKYLHEYKPHTDGNLYHMPVVDINERKCKPEMAGSETRKAFRDVGGGVKIPSICGEDLDKLIQAIVPRPEFPPVPESVVRLPEVN